MELYGILSQIIQQVQLMEVKMRYCTIEFIPYPLEGFDDETHCLMTDKTAKEVAIAIEEKSGDKLIRMEPVEKSTVKEAWDESFRATFAGIEVPDRKHYEEEELEEYPIDVFISFYSLVPETFYIAWDAANIREA
jgi:hypothetical protein